MKYKRTKFTPDTEEEWLGLRKPDLTSTMMPALFNLSPYTTTFELYHNKVTKVEVPFETNDRVEKGKRIEEFAAQEVAIAQGWKARRNPEYIRLPELRMGSSFDFHAACPERGNGILEIKAVDYFRHKDQWSEDEIPAHIEIQARHQMFVSDVQWVCVAAFTGIYDHHLYFIERDTDFDDGLIEAAKEFWAMVDDEAEPLPNYTLDGAMIDQLYRNVGGELIDLTEDSSFEMLIERYEYAKSQEKFFKTQKDAAKAEAHRTLENNAGAFTNNYRVKASRTKDNDGTLITKDMVGQVIGKRSGHRRLDVSKTKEKS